MFIIFLKMLFWVFMLTQYIDWLVKSKINIIQNNNDKFPSFLLRMFVVFFIVLSITYIHKHIIELDHINPKGQITVEKTK